MNYHKYNSVHNRNSFSRPEKSTEAAATKWLQGRIFFGVGPRYLGWQLGAYEEQPDGSDKEIYPEGPRCWKIPTEIEWYKWNPLLDHLKGRFRGLVWRNATHVPFVTVDLDRHSADILAKNHIREVMATGRLLITKFSQAQGYRLHWCVEVNPNNGSVKFFGWGDRPIPIDIAQKIGETIHEALGRNGLLGKKHSREVFPYNHPQVLLPMRVDKITVIDTGVLPTCTRKKKDFQGGMENYETYSVLAFTQWLRQGGHFCEKTLQAKLIHACDNLPDQPKIEEISDKKSPEPDSPEEKNTRTHRYSGAEADNPNSFERQHAALLPFCRKIGRVVSEKEAMDYIKANRLYTDSWQDTLARRKGRVRWILRQIAKTFDPSKCQGVRHEVPIGKYDQWAKHHVGQIKGKSRRDLDDFGNLIIQENRYRVNWSFTSAFLSVVEFCLITSPNEDGSLPQVRAEDIWNRCYAGGQIGMPFDEKKWAICRDWLERKGIIKVVDRNWQRGKAMRWAVSDDFHSLPDWWRREKRVSPLEAVSLEAFLKDKREHTHSLNSYPLQGGWETDENGLSPALLVRPPP